MALHKNIPYACNHVAHSLEYTDATARNTVSGVATEDIGRIARQLDTGDFYILDNVDGGGVPSWCEICPDGVGTDEKVGVSANDTTPDYLFNKLAAGSTKLSITETNDGGDEDVTLDVVEANINHDNLTSFVANEHIDHSVITLTAGVGLSGGGDITANRSFDLDVNSLTADATPDGAADYVATYDASAGGHKKVLLNDLPSGGGGDVTAGANIADNVIVRGDGGIKGIQGSLPTIDDAGQILAVAGTKPAPGIAIGSANTGWWEEPSGDLASSVGGQEILEIQTDGRVIISNDTPNYETLVTADNVIPNKKYVDDTVLTKRIYDAIVDTAGSGDYTSIKSAFDAGHQSVFVRAGTYVESGHIDLPQNVVLHGEAPGAVVCVLNGAYSVRLDGTARKITAGTISVNNGSTAVTGVGTTFTTLQTDDYIELDGVFHKIATVTDNLNLVLDATYRGRSLSSASFVGQSMFIGANITNMIFANSTIEGLLIKQSFHVTIRDSLVSNCGTAATSSGIKIQDSAECLFLGLLTENAKYNGIHILDSRTLLMNTCAFKNSNGAGVLVDNCNGLIFDGCYSLQNNAEGINITNSSTRINITDGVIARNQGKGINTDTGVGTCILDSVTIRDSGSWGIDFDGTDNIINDCIIDNNASGGIVAGDFGVIQGCRIINNSGVGINADNDQDCAITGNFIKGNSNNGIKAGLNNAITGNQIFDNGTDGIEIAAAADDCIVANNRISGHTNGVQILSGAVDTIVRGNNLKGNTTGVSDSGTTSDVTGNK